ncbi:tetratricopeptide repeat protein [Myroides odoratimimus]|uniref:tetratricopeptide repeat protein n=1 Tax=Myroides odoratimimus TaxID=76832 RepID=UPI0025769066|nr:tetratricopeptide repeat protein [Myroides odoratimimus]MDM1396669.1 tetratricopeptide repeat protein [Myroides odoratimimus]
MKNKLTLLSSLLMFFILIGNLMAQNKIQVLSAVIKDKKIEGAQVLIQRNGEQTISGYTDRNGMVNLNVPYADDADTKVIIKKDGYSTLVAKCACAGMTYAISPAMKNLDGMRIVLTWGSTPADLDSHLWFPNNHVYFNNKSGTKANLDVDDTDGYGPETITIEEKKFGSEYYYAVHDYTNKSSTSSSQMSKSRATVFVYVGQSLVRTYYVPQNKFGNLWTVFKVTKEGEIEDINSYTTVSYGDRGDLRYTRSGELGSLDNINKEEALRLNNLATKEYNKQNYTKAIELYTAAISNYPNFSQAYGNLGLSYKKNGQYAEALWANRKAISLANGPTVRAGAYYNIGRIYEDQGEYEKAREQYRMSKSNVDKPVYDEAIQRMTDKLNR